MRMTGGTPGAGHWPGCTVTIRGRPTQVIGLDDLIRIKRHINRPKDRESLLQLEAIKRLREQEGLR
jgi:predicted nucleotidyltransferase